MDVVERDEDRLLARGCGEEASDIVEQPYSLTLGRDPTCRSACAGL